ncbi:hypothetical protein OS493_012313 [Desmophyllum pertusum]|uniref:PHD-type domain-containing protein n=1 Tax=Desmophyllum pertusum TaxID=174260 RepID=A0A9X0D3X3_9CNID|nr:hypothetical protein OS493_012313 [Desmophyllum pertusum]
MCRLQTSSLGSQFHASVGAKPSSFDVMKEVVKQNKCAKKKSIIDRFQQSLQSKLETDCANVLSWLNPVVNISVNGKFVPAVGVRSLALEQFAQVSVKELSNHLKQVTDSKGSIAMMFAIDEECSVEDLKQRKKGKWRKAAVVSKIEDCPESQSNQEDCLTDSFTENLTPESKKQWTSFSPHSRETFKKGFEWGKRLTVAVGTKNCEASAQPEGVNLCTPSTSGSHDAELSRPKKRLFPEGTFGVLPRQCNASDGNESYVCSSCGQKSPKKKRWSRKWVQCDMCDKWLHMECSKLTKLPKKKEAFVCSKCKGNK